MKWLMERVSLNRVISLAIAITKSDDPSIKRLMDDELDEAYGIEK